MRIWIGDFMQCHLGIGELWLEIHGTSLRSQVSCEWNEQVLVFPVLGTRTRGLVLHRQRTKPRSHRAAPPTIRESNRSFGAKAIAHPRNRIERRYRSSIFAEDLDKVTIV